MSLKNFWDQGERIALRNYIAQHPNFLRALRELMPKTEGATVESAAMSGMKRAGAEELLDKMTGQLSADKGPETGDAGFIDARQD